MTSKVPIEEVLKLPAEERLELIERIWESLSSDAEQVPVPEWHRRELKRRLQDPSPEHFDPHEVHALLEHLGEA